MTLEIVAFIVLCVLIMYGALLKLIGMGWDEVMFIVSISGLVIFLPVIGNI